MSEYMLSAHIKTYVITWNNKSGGNCGRFAETYRKCERFYKAIWMLLLYHKWRRFPTNTGESECMAGDVMRIFFTLIFHTVKKTFFIFCNAFVIFRNPFYGRYKELIISVIVYFLLHCLLYSVFLFVCDVNFDEIILYSMMLKR